jgi:hypothetical protein
MIILVHRVSPSIGVRADIDPAASKNVENQQKDEDSLDQGVTIANLNRTLHEMVLQFKYNLVKLRNTSSQLRESEEL